MGPKKKCKTPTSTPTPNLDTPAKTPRKRKSGDAQLEMPTDFGSGTSYWATKGYERRDWRDEVESPATPSNQANGQRQLHLESPGMWLFGTFGALPTGIASMISFHI